MQKATRWTDQDLEQFIGNLLRTGVLIAAAVVLIGGASYLFHHRSDRADYRVFHQESQPLHSIRGVARDAFALHSLGVIQLGLLLLVLTPISRVAFSAVGFFLQGDRMYVAITLIVLAILLFSLLRAG